jgi:UDP-3-O-[3-hydroxymyristoyl] glucosamine N-acyltransferase
MKFSDLVQQLGIDNHHSLIVKPGCDPDLTGVEQIEQARSGTLSYIEGAKFAAYLTTTPASALVLPLDAELQSIATDRGIAWVAAAQPRKLLAEIIALFYQPFRLAPEIHPTAVIHPSVQLGEGVAIGAHVVIQADVTIGDEVCIHPNCVIYPKVTIAERTTLHANCTIHERSQIGADCMIHSGAVIGSEGFGFVPTSEGWLKMQQSGYAILEDGVEIGCNSTVDRPALGTTRIGRNTKIDNLVHIAHGCQVGENCVMAGQVGLSGAVTVGDRVILAGQVGIVDHVKIGDGAIASAKAGVHHDIEPGTMVTGIPAIPHKLFVKATAVFNRLPEMYQTLRRLQRQNSQDS